MRKYENYEKFYFLDGKRLRCMYCKHASDIVMDFIKDVSFVDMPEAEAEAICSSVLRRRISHLARFDMSYGVLSVTMSKGENGTFYSLYSGYANAQSSNELRFLNSRIPKKMKHQTLLSIFLDVAANGQNVICSSDIFNDAVRACTAVKNPEIVVIPRHTTLEQLIIEKDLHEVRG